MTRCQRFLTYPNPANTELNLAFEARKQDGRVIVTDVYGRQIMSTDVMEGQAYLSLETHEWQNGVYFISLLFEGEDIVTQSVIISH